MQPRALVENGAPRALAGGGRYDMLFKALGAPAPLRGVGAALKLDVILAEVERQNSDAAGAATQPMAGENS